MIEALPDGIAFATFLGASFVLAATLGPGVLYIVLRSATQGLRSGLASVAGVAAGNLANATGAALGLAVIFSASAAAFTVVKWAGAAYLVWLGVRTLLAPISPDRQPKLLPLPRGRVWRDGFLVALLNPKTTLFFAAFLPQFLDPGAPKVSQILLLGTLFVGIACCTDALYAIGASRVSRLLGNTHSMRQKVRAVSGSVFIAMGLFAAFSGQRTVR